MAPTISATIIFAMTTDRGANAAPAILALNDKRCETCRHWFDYQSPPPPYPTPYRPCNHPSVGGQGRAPLKLPTDGCKKHELHP